jgi:hypothetical protein
VEFRFCVDLTVFRRCKLELKSCGGVLGFVLEEEVSMRHFFRLTVLDTVNGRLISIHYSSIFQLPINPYSLVLVFLTLSGNTKIAYNEVE